MKRTELIEKLNEIRSLEKNWDSYGGKSFPYRLVEKCCFLVDSLEEDKYLPSFVCPISGGEYIQFEWSCQGRELEIEISETTVNYLKVSHNLSFSIVGALSIGEDEDEGSFPFLKNEIINIDSIKDLIKWVLWEK
jgi:hypothetical protein